MRRRRPSTSWFALPAPPPATLTLGGTTRRLARVFKHDFWAATALYEADGPPADPVVVKFYRTQPFCGLPLGWLGRFCREHERAVYAALAGVPGVPRCLGPVGDAALAVAYVRAVPLDHLEAAPPGWFDDMRRALDAVHARGVAYVDANKRSNMLVDPEGRAYLIDFQIALRRRDDWPRPLRWLSARLVAYFRGRDLYHLYKHKRRLARGELTEAEARLSRRRGPGHELFRRLSRLYRAVRRPFLTRRWRAGRLVSPTADLEDHHQPEKATWRKP